MSSPADPSLPTEAVEAAAAAWLSLRDRGMSPDETTAFLRWLQQDARHAEIFGELDRTWQNFDRLAAVPASTARPDADLLAPRPRPHRRVTPAWLAFGAAAALALALVGGNALRAPRHTAETEVGAFRKLDLPDGSVAQLNTDSALDVAFTAHERRVRVVRGEVFFNVTKDSTRPFLVAAGPIVVRAVGTAFNVRHRTDAVEVLVTEGRVRVDDEAHGSSTLPATAATAEGPLLVAGQRAVVPLPIARARSAPAMANVAPITAPAVRRALAWQERRLEFDATPLAEVVQEFNRYNHRQLVIDDAALAARRFSGAFRADGYESFVRLLETDFNVSVERRGEQLVLHAGR